MKGDEIMALIPRFMLNDNLIDDFMFPTVKDNDFGKMKCDIYEKDGVFYLEMDIPGFDKNDVDIQIDDNDYLTITAEKTSVNDDIDNKNYIRKERVYGKYQRSFYIGEIDKNAIEASFENGILKISMPKKEDEKLTSKKIEIK